MTDDDVQYLVEAGFTTKQAIAILSMVVMLPDTDRPEPVEPGPFNEDLPAPAP